MKLAIIGSPNIVHKDRPVRELMFKLKKTYGSTVTIVSGGNPDGVEALVKQTAFEFSLPYQEFNPSFSGHNEHSVMPPEYFTKGWHFSHYVDRYNQMIMRVDGLFVAVEDGVKDNVIDAAIKFAQKNNVKTVII